MHKEKGKPDLKTDENKPKLTVEEEEKVQERSALRPAVVYETIRDEGEHELSRSVSALAWSGLAAGLSMGFSLVAEGLLKHHLPKADWSILIYKFGYSAGFLIVILGRQQLFTENTLTVILPLLLRKDRQTLLNVLRLWGIVLLANIVGALLFAWAVSATGVFSPEIKQTFSEIGREAAAGEWLQLFLAAIFAGWLIALMVWLLPAADTARVWVIIIMTYLVALGGYPHIIAGSAEVFYAAFTGTIEWSRYFTGWVLPTLLGNIVGGVSLVAVLAHAQVANEKNT